MLHNDLGNAPERFSLVMNTRSISADIDVTPCGVTVDVPEYTGFGYKKQGKTGESGGNLVPVLVLDGMLDACFGVLILGAILPTFLRKGDSPE